MTFRVLLVGYSLEAKCRVGNALVKQRDAFRVLYCKSRRLVKFAHHQTIGGKRLEIVVLPNIGTPAWKKEVASLKIVTDAVVYVRSQDIGDVNHEKAVEYVQDVFTDNNKAIQLVVLDYFASERSFSVNDVAMHDEMSFEARQEVAKVLLSTIVNNSRSKETCLETSIKKDKQTEDSIPNTPEDKVPDQTLSQKASDSPDAAKKLDFSDQERENVKVQESEYVCPELTNDDWEMFSKALQHGKTASNHIRVNVVGNQGVGKTTLIKRLQGELTSCEGLQSHPTEALEVSEVTLRCVQSDETVDWEAKPSGFASLFNKQRMAEAMATVSEYFKDEEEADSSLSQDEYEMLKGSDEVKDDESELSTSTDQSYYKNKTGQEERVHFLKEVLREKEKPRKRQIYVSFWDFAGQSTYYSTHQAFLSQNAVYIIVFDLSKDLQCELNDSLTFRSGVKGKCNVKDSVLFWTTSIKTFTVDQNGGRAPIIFVGTHGDEVSDEKAAMKFNEIRTVTALEKVMCIRIDNTIKMDIQKNDVPPDLEMLRSAILNQGLGIYDMKVDARWFDLGNTLLQKSISGMQTTTFKELLEMNDKMDVPLENQNTLRQFLDYMHCRGQLLYFPEHTDDDLVLLNPSLLTNFLNKLMRTSTDTQQSASNIDTRNADGIVEERFILEAAREILVAKHQQTAKHFLRTLSTLKIAFRYEGAGNSPLYILPSLLPEISPSDGNEPAVEKGPLLKLSLDGECVPIGFYHLLLTAFVTRIPDLHVHKENSKPAYFYRHATMYLERKEVIVDMRWEGSNIYIEINNYSNQFSLSSMAIRDRIYQMQLAVQHTADVYRHYNVNFGFEVQCPKHTGSFQPIEDVNDDGTFFCVSKRHDTTITSLSRMVEQMHIESPEKAKDINMQQHPKDCHFSRLALKLPADDNAKVLAAKLGLPRQQALDEFFDANLRRLRVFFKWRQINMNKTLQQLISKLCKSRDYDETFLINIVKSDVCRKGYNGIPDDVLDGELDPKVISKVAENVGIKYPLLMAELGVPENKVDTSRSDRPNNCISTVYDLLHWWKQQRPLDANLRCLLNTMDHLDFNTSPLVRNIARLYDTA